MIRRIPKRGFHNFTRKEYALVNLADLDLSGLKEADPQSLRSAGIVKGTEPFVKILGVGDITRAVSVKAHRISASAKEKIEKAGGKVEVMDVRG